MKANIEAFAYPCVKVRSERKANIDLEDVISQKPLPIKTMRVLRCVQIYGGNSGIMSTCALNKLNPSI